MRRCTLIQAWRAPRLLLPSVLPARYDAAADLHTYERDQRGASGDVGYAPSGAARSRRQPMATSHGARRSGRRKGAMSDGLPLSVRASGARPLRHRPGRRTRHSIAGANRARPNIRIGIQRHSAWSRTPPSARGACPALPRHNSSSRTSAADGHALRGHVLAPDGGSCLPARPRRGRRWAVNVGRSGSPLCAPRLSPRPTLSTLKALPIKTQTLHRLAMRRPCQTHRRTSQLARFSL